MMQLQILKGEKNTENSLSNGNSIASKFEIYTPCSYVNLLSHPEFEKNKNKNPYTLDQQTSHPHSTCTGIYEGQSSSSSCF